MSPLDRLEWLSAVASDGNLTLLAMRLAIKIADGTNAATGRSFASRGATAADLNVHPDTVKRAARLLERRGWLLVNPGRGRGKATEYAPAMRSEKAAACVQPFAEGYPQGYPQDVQPKKGAEKGAEKAAPRVQPLQGLQGLQDLSRDAFPAPGFPTRERARAQEGALASEQERRKANGVRRKANGGRDWRRASDAELVAAARAAGLQTHGKTRDELCAALGRTR